MRASEFSMDRNCKKYEGVREEKKLDVAAETIIAGFGYAITWLIWKGAYVLCMLLVARRPLVSK